jgi:hypothetical protein
LARLKQEIPSYNPRQCPIDIPIGFNAQARRYVENVGSR